MHAKADVCLINRQQKDVLLLVQEEKRSTVDTNDAQHQLVAQAIAAFQYNNTLRTQVGEPAIKSQVLALSCYFMLCIDALFRSYRASSFLVPRLYFYKIPVSEDLIRHIRRGTYPLDQTVISAHVPPLPNHRYSEGIKPSTIAMRFCAFKRVVGIV